MYSAIFKKNGGRRLEVDYDIRKRMYNCCLSVKRTKPSNFVFRPRPVCHHVLELKLAYIFHYHNSFP